MWKTLKEENNNNNLYYHVNNKEFLLFSLISVHRRSFNALNVTVSFFMSSWIFFYMRRSLLFRVQESFFSSWIFLYSSGEHASVPITMGFSANIRYHRCCCFFVIWKGSGISLFFFSCYILWSFGTENSTIWQILFSLVNLYMVNYSGRNLVIRQFTEKPKFMHLILLNGLWRVPLLFYSKLCFIFCIIPWEYILHQFLFYYYIYEFAYYVIIL